MPNMTTLSGTNLPLLKVLTSSFVSLHEALTPCEDCWTLNTTTNESYEEVVVLELTRDTVLVEHKYGVATIARADLDRESQQWLIDNSLMAEPELGIDDHLAHARPMTRPERFSRAA